MLLPRGVTGFATPEEGVNRPGLRDFRADCWQVALALNAKVENRETRICTSFESHMLVWPDSALVVLLNNTLPILALCQPYPDGTVTFDFTDNEKVADLFEQIGKYEIWRKQDLDAPLTDEMCERLGAAEKRELKYWRHGWHTMRVGDVVFNHWD
jgi:hypothetical protein